MRNLIQAAALVFVFASSTAQSQTRAMPNEPGMWFVAGEGSDTCGRYLEKRSEQSRNQNYIYFVWVRGYISARNEKSRKMYVSIDQHDVLSYLDKYCRDNPLHPIAYGASKLYEEVGGER